MKYELENANVYESWHQISEDQVKMWISTENLEKKEKRTFQGFEIINSIDGRPDTNVEVSFVRLLKEGQYPQHVHNNSNAYFIVTSGKAVFLSGSERINMEIGDRRDVPRGTPHGFEIEKNEIFEFISIQSPPIKDEKTGEEDFHLIDAV